MQRAKRKIGRHGRYLLYKLYKVVTLALDLEIRDCDLGKAETQCNRSPLFQLRSLCDEEEILNLIRRHRLSITVLSTTRCRRGHSVSDLIEQDALVDILEALRIKFELKRIAKAAEKEEIAYMAIKGITLAKRTTGETCGRGGGDIDLFVSSKKVSDVLKWLERLGYKRTYDEFPERTGATVERYLMWVHNQISMYRRDRIGEIWIDLHWSLGKQRASLPSFEEAWEKRQQIEVDDTMIPTLSDEHAFIHSCCHAAGDRWMSVRNLVDIHRFIKLGLITKSQLSRLSDIKAVALSLAVTERVTGIRVLKTRAGRYSRRQMKAIAMAEESHLLAERERDRGGKGLIDFAERIRFHLWLTDDTWDKLRVICFFVLPPRAFCQTENTGFARDITIALSRRFRDMIKGRKSSD